MENIYYVVRVTDPKTGNQITRLCGKDTLIDERLLETFGTTMITNGDAKTRICKKCEDKLGSTSDWYLLEEACRQFDFEVYPYPHPEVHHDLPKDLNTYDPYFYPHVIARLREDFDKFVREECGEQITKFDFLDKI